MTKLYVRNLDAASTEQSVRSLFEPYGAVQRIRMNTNRGESRNGVLAFVEMTEASAADEAIHALHGSNSGDRILRVLKSGATRSLPKLSSD
jgi:RNA recognition motif-containing protein